MKKSINLNSAEWCDMIFEDKNKSYGAYQLRQNSSRRHILAFLFAILFTVLVGAVPYALGAINDNKGHEPPSRGYTGPLVMENLEDQVPEENIIREETAPPPPPLRATIRYVPPVIGSDVDVADADVVTVDEVLESGSQISIATIISDNDEGIDIADLPNQAVIMEVEDTPFEIVEQMPSYPGGEREMMKYIGDNMRYPVVAQESNIQGRVVIRFVVTANGEIDQVEVVRPLDPSCDREAVRVIKSMPRWTPGRQNGKEVAVYFTLPVLFRLK